MPHLLSAPGGAGTRLHATSTVTSLTSGSCLHQTTSSSRPSCPRPPSAPFLQRCVVQKRRPTLTRRAPRPIGTLEFRAVQALRMPPPHTTPTIPPPAPPVAVSCRTVGVAPSYSDTLLSAPLPPTPLPLLAALNCAAHHKHTHAHCYVREHTERCGASVFRRRDAGRCLPSRSARLRRSPSAPTRTCRSTTRRAPSPPLHRHASQLSLRPLLPRGARSRLSPCRSALVL